MSKRHATPRKPPAAAETPPDVPRPVSVVDGIPDRAAETPAWKYLLLAGIFLAWLAVLVYCAAAGNIN